MAMADLIQDLVADHVALLDTWNRARQRGVTSAEGREILLQLKGTLIAHLRKEDFFLYPVLKRAAAQDKRLQELMQSFVDDMAHISKTAIAFFDKYRGGGSDTEFAQEFGRLYATFMDRHEREEKLLYPEFRKIQERQ